MDLMSNLPIYVTSVADDDIFSPGPLSSLSASVRSRRGLLIPQIFLSKTMLEIRGT